jgi:hypothetical protein
LPQSELGRQLRLEVFGPKAGTPALAQNDASLFQKGAPQPDDAKNHAEQPHGQDDGGDAWLQQRAPDGFGVCRLFEGLRRAGLEQAGQHVGGNRDHLLARRRGRAEPIGRHKLPQANQRRHGQEANDACQQDAVAKRFRSTRKQPGEQQHDGAYANAAQGDLHGEGLDKGQLLQQHGLDHG